MSKRQKIGLLLTICTLAVVLVFALVPTTPQNLSYHHFSDSRGAWGIPNVGDVLSNVTFLVAGLYGLWVVYRRRPEPARLALQVFFIGVLLVAPGSAYYHWAPDNGTLFWDRLPMTVAFMGLTAAVIADRIDAAWGNRVALPLLVAVGLASAVWWRFSEADGAGDLRAYALVQFLPMVLIPLMLVLFLNGRTIGWRAVGTAFVFYSLAKVTEHYDAEVLQLLAGSVSGHTIKHQFAAIGPMAMAWALKDQALGSSSVA